MKKNIDTIYLKIKLDKNNEFLEDLREQGLLFETIVEALQIDRENIEEIESEDVKEIDSEDIKE